MDIPMKRRQRQGIDGLAEAVAFIRENSSEAEESPRNRTLFEQYILRNTQHLATRQQLLKDYQDGAPLTGPDGLRRQLAAIDLKYFGMAYLPHYFVTEPPPFHEELDDIWSQGVMKAMNPFTQAEDISFARGCRRAIEAPRGHAKSTSFTFKDTLHAVMYGYKHYVIILSDSSEQAEGFLTDIRTEFEENGMIREDFGGMEGKVWKSNVLLTANHVKIEAIGSGKKLRGRRHGRWRPDLVICDDLENDENINTPQQRLKLESWFNKAVSNIGDTYTDIVYIGTLLHYDSLLAKVSKKGEYKSRKYRAVESFASNTELWAAWEALYNDLEDENHQETAWDFFEANREEMLRGTVVLWPAKWDYYSLMVKKLSIGDAAFGSEYQNDPIDPDNCVFSEENMDFWDDPEMEQPDFSDPRFIFIAANDPSLGKNQKADTSAILAAAIDIRTGYIYMVTADITRRKPDVIINDIFALSRQLRDKYKKSFYLFGVETVQFQLFFKDVLARMSVELGEYLPIEEILTRQNKDVRIRSTEPAVKNGYVKFSRKHKTLLKQMTEYPMGANDDGPDCLEMILRLASSIRIALNRPSYQTVQARALRFDEGAY